MTTEQTPTEIKAEFKKNWEEMKAVNDARLDALEKGQSTTEYDGRIADIESKMEAYDKLSGDYVKQETMDEKIAALKAEHSGRIDDLTAALKRPAIPDDPEAVSVEFKAYDSFLRKDERKLTTDEIKTLEGIKTLTVGDDSSLGYAAPKEVVRDFNRNLVESSPFRTLARVRRTSARSIEIPTRRGTTMASWIVEIGTKDKDSDALSLGMEVIDLNELYARTFISQQTLEDSEFNVEQEIRRDYIEQFALAENAAFMSGDGIQKPEGVLTNGDIEITKSGSATELTFAGIMNLIHSIKSGYNLKSTLLFNRSTLGAIRLLKDGSGQYIFQQGMSGQSGVPNMIAGHRYLEMPNMPDIAANSTPILFGDFSKGYTVVDRLSLVTTRDPYTRQSKGQVLFSGRRRVGGKVTLPEAIKKLQIAA